MEVTPNNPPTNKLGSGLNAADIRNAVLKSGYPLQTIIANLLRGQVGEPGHVQEEWSYIDEDSHEVRTIDILAEKWLWDFTQEQPRVRPDLDLLVECKKSDLPYVFFLSPTKPWVPHFPLLAGLFRDTLIVTTDDSPSTWEFPVLQALELDSHPFIKEEPEYCFSFTKCERKGKGVQLSGSEPFHELVLPILKAMYHFKKAESPTKTAWYFDCHLTIGIGVLDAPMVGVRVSEKSHDLELLPWVRVVRHKTSEEPDWTHPTELFAVEIIHKDFLDEYLNLHVIPFAREFCRLATKHQHVLASGEAFASGMERYWSRKIEQRLKPREISARVSRFKAIGRNILRLLTGRKPVD